jgi:glycosyltransferase involved in cell wall biosynthesis
MNREPDVSVVMSIYNGARSLGATIESVLTQDASFELIAVNDGSTDPSAAVLDSYARSDRRVKVIHQNNQGLTRALIRGCRVARGEYLARQDVGDVSLPGKLSKQLSFARDHPTAALVSCGTRFVGPNHEFLYNVLHDPSDATDRLLTLRIEDLRGPSSHPSAMFRRALYSEVGGYRSAFNFAQDLDLWIRLAERGDHIVMPEILYEASIDITAISARYRKEQISTAKLILECAKLRRQGLSEELALQRASYIKPSPSSTPGRLARARALYFIGTCLNKNDRQGAEGYFRRALTACPLHVKAMLRLIAG